MVRICWDIKKMLKLKNWKTPWGLNDFVPVCYALCLKIPAQSVPISTPQTLAPQGLLAQQLQPSKGVQSSCSEVTPWHMIWNSTIWASCDKIHVLHFKRWKTNHFLPKKARKCRKCRRRLPRLRAAAGAHCELTRNSVGERSWWQNKWWKSMERWESMEIIH